MESPNNRADIYLLDISCHRMKGMKLPVLGMGYI